MRDLLLPTSYGNRLSFPWLLIYQERSEAGPPMFFLTHGRNFSKFENRKGFRIMGHIKDKRDAIIICQQHNDQITKKPRKRPGYQLSKLDKGVDLTGLGKPQEPKPMLILPKDFKKDIPNG